MVDPQPPAVSGNKVEEICQQIGEWGRYRSSLKGVMPLGRNAHESELCWTCQRDLQIGISEKKETVTESARSKLELRSARRLNPGSTTWCCSFFLRQNTISFASVRCHLLR